MLDPPLPILHRSGGLREPGDSAERPESILVQHARRPGRHRLAHTVRAVRVADRMDRVRPRQDRRWQVRARVLVRRGSHVERVVVLVEEVPEPPPPEHLDLQTQGGEGCIYTQYRKIDGS